MSTNASSEPAGAMALAYRAMTAQRAYADAIASGLEQARRAYEQAQQTYNQEFQFFYAELLERTQQAYRAYSESLNGAYTSAPGYEDCTNAYRQYVERLQELFTGGDAIRLHKEAYDKYLARLSSQPSAAAEAAETFRREVEETWKQKNVLTEVESARRQYTERLQRLSEEASIRQNHAWRDLLQHLGEIWSQPETATRAQGALSRLMTASREVTAKCHETIEKGVAKAVEALNAPTS
jgi:GTP1/Obg family GTP-binding protein